MKNNPRYVQVKNPKTGNYTKIDTKLGIIIEHSITGTPFENILIIKQNKRGGEDCDNK